MSYASGFAQGELDAFKDRANRVTREMNEDPRNEEERGYWDAYSPRSATWGALQHSPATCVTVDAYEAHYTDRCTYCMLMGHNAQNCPKRKNA